MKTIEIKYQVDNSDWTDEEFDERTDRVYTLPIYKLEDILRSEGLLNKGEFIHDIERVEFKYR
ncbi:MAG: hypothetical protein CMH22_05630 [Methylophaga sp.]|nr:hypothetical protein [Methylophaga sp.]|tara:strand:+ start:105340 stop:105528 length:189 start_codon:yes stop_codon:yes gene_type:complete